MSQTLRFGPLSNRTVHLCVDMQRMFAPGSAWGSPWVPKVLPNIIPLVEAAPERTVFTRFLPPQYPDDRSGMWRIYFERWREMTLARLHPSMVELLPELARYTPPASVFDKSGYSAFTSSALTHWLRDRLVDTLLITGAETDVCILSTILGAVEYGYRVIVVVDAVCSSSDGGHDDLLELYRRRFSEQIEAAPVAEILEQWPPH